MKEVLNTDVSGIGKFQAVFIIDHLIFDKPCPLSKIYNLFFLCKVIK